MDTTPAARRVAPVGPDDLDASRFSYGFSEGARGTARVVPGTRAIDVEMTGLTPDDARRLARWLEQVAARIEALQQSGLIDAVLWTELDVPAAGGRTLRPRDALCAVSPEGGVWARVSGEDVEAFAAEVEQRLQAEMPGARMDTITGDVVGSVALAGLWAHQEHPARARAVAAAVDAVLRARQAR